MRWVCSDHDWHAGTDEGSCRGVEESDDGASGRGGRVMTVRTTKVSQSRVPKREGPGAPASSSQVSKARPGAPTSSKGVRKGVVVRDTNETRISIVLTIEGKGVYKVSTGIRFFDHMLELFTRHGAFDLELTCRGDLDVDQHHTVEDVGIALGEAFD